MRGALSPGGQICLGAAGPCLRVCVAVVMEGAPEPFLWGLCLAIVRVVIAHATLRR